MDFSTGSRIKACIPNSTSFEGLRDEAQSAILEFTQGSMPIEVFLDGMAQMHDSYLTMAECIVQAFALIV
jgi:hypothetical protein